MSRTFTAAAFCVSLLAACGTTATESLAGVVIAPAPAVGDLTLPRADNGRDHRFIARAGGLLLVFFGFTHCPDVCPLTLSYVSGALKTLGGDADRVDLAMITVDPRRDTAPVLTEYLHSFEPSWIPLRTTDEAALLAVADGFGATYFVTGDGADTDVGHTGTLYAVDDTGTIRVQWSHGTDAEVIAADVHLLLDDGVTS